MQTVRLLICRNSEAISGRCGAAMFEYELILCVSNYTRAHRFRFVTSERRVCVFVSEGDEISPFVVIKLIFWAVGGYSLVEVLFLLSKNRRELEQKTR